MSQTGRVSPYAMRIRSLILARLQSAELDPEVTFGLPGSGRSQAEHVPPAQFVRKIGTTSILERSRTNYS